jgi:hypothetical protein
MRITALSFHKWRKGKSGGGILKGYGQGSGQPEAKGFSKII